MVKFCSIRVLQVKANGSMVGDLDLFHHRPYECILLGQCYGEKNSEDLPRFKTLKNNQIIISVPGDYSRKPPLGGIFVYFIAKPLLFIVNVFSLLFSCLLTVFWEFNLFLLGMSIWFLKKANKYIAILTSVS